MAKERPVYQVFVSSPGEVLAEQRIAGRVATEFNSIWGRFFSIHVEALRYESDLYPQSASDPQAAINETIGDTYDLYVGLMWKRFGTPTPRAGSGTEEEFDRAVARHRKRPESVQVAFYFRNITDADRLEAGNEIQMVEAFRNRMGPVGNLWWTYRDPADFEGVFRIHLARHVQRWLLGKPDLLKTIGAEYSTQPTSQFESTPDSDVGDVLDDLTDVMNRFTQDMKPHGEVWAAQSANTDDLRAAFDGILTALRTYTLGLDRTLPRFAKAFAASFRGPGRAAVHALGASAGVGKNERVALTLIILSLQLQRVKLDTIIGSIMTSVEALFTTAKHLRDLRAVPETRGVATDALRASSALLTEMIRADERLKQVSAMLEEIRGEVSG